MQACAVTHSLSTVTSSVVISTDSSVVLIMLIGHVYFVSSTRQFPMNTPDLVSSELTIPILFLIVLLRSFCYEGSVFFFFFFK